VAAAGDYMESREKGWQMVGLNETNGVRKGADFATGSYVDDILQRVIKVVAEAQKLPIEKVTADSTFEELAIDSLDGIQLLFHSGVGV
jgi:hypothetical protein